MPPRHLVDFGPFGLARPMAEHLREQYFARPARTYSVRARNVSPHTAQDIGTDPRLSIEVDLNGEDIRSNDDYYGWNRLPRLN